MTGTTQNAGIALPGTAGHPINVLIVDDQALVRNGFSMILSSYPYVRVVGEAANGLEGLEAAKLLLPDVVLMDIRMPVLDGIEATRRLAQDPVTRACKVLILTTFDLDEYVFDALGAGASGFLLKDADPDDLVDAIKVIAQGEALLAPSITRKLIERFVRSDAGCGSGPGAGAAGAGAVDPRMLRPAVLGAFASGGVPAGAAGDFAVAASAPVGAADAGRSQRLSELTERELEVLAGVAQGLSNAQIAERLVISPATAKTHVGRIMQKLEAHDRAQLVIVAYETGLVQPGQ